MDNASCLITTLRVICVVVGGKKKRLVLPILTRGVPQEYYAENVYIQIFEYRHFLEIIAKFEYSNYFSNLIYALYISLNI